MRHKHFLLYIAMMVCFGLFLTSCSQGDEMDDGGMIGGKDPDNRIRSAQSISTPEANDTITVPKFIKD